MSFSSSNCLFLEPSTKDFPVIQLCGDRSADTNFSGFYEQGYVLKNRKEVVCDDCGTVVDDVEAHDAEACREALNDRFE